METKNDILSSLRGLTTCPDDDNIRFKQRIKENLLSCPELLYALDNPEYEGELFDNEGNINTDGSWDLYFGDNIKPFMFIPEVDSKTKNYLCYSVGFQTVPTGNKIEKYGNIEFLILCDEKNCIDKRTGIPRHDLIASIIREKFNWGNVFDSQCRLIGSEESITDKLFVTRALIFRTTSLNSIVKTGSNGTSVINNKVG